MDREEALQRPEGQWGQGVVPVGHGQTLQHHSPITPTESSAFLSSGGSSVVSVLSVSDTCRIPSPALRGSG